eukprot:6196362-Pleurochrysis_carterae.AAC.1
MKAVTRAVTVLSCRLLPDGTVSGPAELRAGFATKTIRARPRINARDRAFSKRARTIFLQMFRITGENIIFGGRIAICYTGFPDTGLHFRSTLHGFERSDDVNALHIRLTRLRRRRQRCALQPQIANAAAADAAAAAAATAAVLRARRCAFGQGHAVEICGEAVSDDACRFST